jgi:hypothetical protein
MNDRLANTPSHPCKSQTLEVLYNGRSYIICNEGQINYQRMLAKEMTLCDMSVAGIDVTDEQVNEIVEKWMIEKCQYATLDYVLGLMTPAEREIWKANYRFSGVSRPK